MTTTADHTELVHAIRVALGREPDFTIWQNSKVTYDRRTGKPKAKPGLQTGASDLVGILFPYGRMVCLEAKTGNATLMPHQRLFAQLIRSRGGFATVVRSVDDARAALDRARRGDSE